MKDYRLSEIKNDCLKNKGDCRKCRFGVAKGFHGNYECIRYDYPMEWEIDEKDGDEE